MRVIFFFIFVGGVVLQPISAKADEKLASNSSAESIDGKDVLPNDEAPSLNAPITSGGDVNRDGAAVKPVSENFDRTEAHGVDAEDPLSPNPEMVHFESVKTPVQAEPSQEDPLDADETNATLAIIGADIENADNEGPDELQKNDIDVDALMDRLKPYKKGDKELSIGIGGSGYRGGFTLLAGAVFTYFLVNQFGPGIEIDYQATWGDIEYPQSLTIFPFLKYVLIRSHRFAPYLLAGWGRTMEWGGVDDGFDPETGDLEGYAPVSSWVMGVGGGFIIGVGARAKIQIQLLAMYRKLDETIWRETSVARSTELDGNGIPVTTYELVGERTDHYWYPSPSFWFSFAL